MHKAVLPEKHFIQHAYCKRAWMAKLPLLLETLLQHLGNLAIIDMKNKNAAAYGCGNTRKPMQVLVLPTQRPFGRTAGNIIQHSGLFCKGRFLSLYSLRLCCIRALLLTLCGSFSCAAFLFFARCLSGVETPPRYCGEKRDTD